MKALTFGLFCAAFVISTTCPLLAQSRIDRQAPFQQDGPVMQFITVEALEVRVEIVAQCEDLLRHLRLPLTNPTFILASEKERILREATRYFESLFILFNKGIPTKPTETRGYFLNLGDPESVTEEVPQDEPLADAVMGISFRFKLENFAESLEVVWSQLPEYTNRIPVQIWTPEEIQTIELSEFLLTASWANTNDELKLPQISAIEITLRDWLGRARLNEKSARKVVEDLIRNIYLAFDYRDESDVYDMLAISVAGEQLASIYLEHRNRLEAIARGGPQAKILELEVQEIRSTERRKKAYKVEAVWQVQGEVSHFGHVHLRENAYHARLTLRADESVWKIEEINILEETRIR